MLLNLNLKNSVIQKAYWIKAKTGTGTQLQPEEIQIQTTATESC